jgi:uncharacterized protein YndB with AHSA1/START domain
MLDRQKLEAILTNRFPEAPESQLAAAANAIMSLAGHHTVERTRSRMALVGEGDGLQRAQTPMTTVTVSSQIDAPISRVFDAFTDVEHAPGRVSGIRSIEMLTRRRFGLGTRWQETREMFGRPDTAEMEVTAFDRYRTYTISHQKGGVRIDTAFSFESAGNGSRVTIEFTLEGVGLPTGLLTPLNWAIAGKVRRVLNRDLLDMKNWLERADAA